MGVLWVGEAVWVRLGLSVEEDGVGRWEVVGEYGSGASCLMWGWPRD